MTIFSRQPAGSQQFAKVLNGIAGEHFSYAPGTILALRAGASDWPEPIRTWLRQPPGNAIAVRIAEGPPEWAPVKPVQIDPDAFTRMQQPRKPAPKARMFDRAEVLAHTGLSDGEFDAALAFGFPASVQRRVRHDGNSTINEPLWNEFQVDAWMARRREAIGR